MTDPEFELLNCEELAAILRLSIHGVRALIVRGRLPAFKLKGRWHVRRSVLLHTMEHWEADNTVLTEEERRAYAYDLPDIPIAPGTTDLPEIEPSPLDELPGKG